MDTYEYAYDYCYSTPVGLHVMEGVTTILTVTVRHRHSMRFSYLFGEAVFSRLSLLLYAHVTAYAVRT